MATGRPHKTTNVRFEPMHAIIRNWKHIGLKHRDALVWFALWERAHFKTNRVTKVSQTKLATQLKMPVSSLNVSLKRLEDGGWLHRKRGGPGRPTEYQLTSPPETGISEKVGNQYSENLGDNDSENLGDNDSDFCGDSSVSPQLAPRNIACAGAIRVMPRGDTSLATARNGKAAWKG